MLTDSIVLDNKSSNEYVIYQKYYYLWLNNQYHSHIINSHKFEKTDKYSIVCKSKYTLYKCINGCESLAAIDYNTSGVWFYYLLKNKQPPILKDKNYYICQNILVNEIL